MSISRILWGSLESLSEQLLTRILTHTLGILILVHQSEVLFTTVVYTLYYVYWGFW